MRLRGALLAGAALLGCSGGAPPGSAGSAVLPQGQVARAGAELISTATLSRIVGEQGTVPQAAAAAAISDALFAQGARESLAPVTTRTIERAAVARSLLEQLR